MAQNDLRLHRVQGKVPPGVGQGPGGVAKAVQPVGGVRVVPVVEKIVVEQSAPRSGRRREPQGAQAAARAVAVIGHGHAVQQARVAPCCT